MNKKILAIAFISFALMITSCSANKDNTPERVSGGQTKVAVTENSGAAKAGENNNASGFSITYNGVKIVLDAETEPVVKAIGGNPVYTEKPSCAYVGIDYTYDYGAFVLYAQSKDGKELINTIEVRSDSVDVCGAKVGQTLEEVKKVMGQPTSDDETAITYVKSGIELQFITDDSGKVVLILYTHETVEE